MKLLSSSPARRMAGVSLIECLVYIAVFLLVLAGALSAFYYCWDNSRAYIGTTDDIAAVLRAGENWRADIRAARGDITQAQTGVGEDIIIPAGARLITYHLGSHTIVREVRENSGGTSTCQAVLDRVKFSHVYPDPRGALVAWRWDVKMEPRRALIRLPLEFNFTAVPQNH